MVYSYKAKSNKDTRSQVLIMCYRDAASEFSSRSRIHPKLEVLYMLP